jgi:hypothetical protein
MKRRSVVRHVTLGALALGLVPLTAPGAGAGPAGESAAAVCGATFGARGPAGGPVVGEGPSGDPMIVSIGWERGDWASDQLGRIVTCVSVDGHAVPALSTSTDSPPNTGSLTLSLTMPPGEPGSVVCEQSVLVGANGAEGKDRPTSPVCFKLRAADPPPPTRAGGRTSDGPPSATPSAPAASRPPTPTPAPTPNPTSTPPARAAFEAAGGATGPSAARASAAPIVAPKAGPIAAAPAVKAPPATSTLPAATGAPGAALARTGFDHRIPLAGAGGLLAFGGAGILFGQPRRRPRAARG